MDDAALLAQLNEYVASQQMPKFTSLENERLRRAMPELKERARTLPQVLEMAQFILGSRPFLPDEKGRKALASVPHGMLSRLTSRLQNASWDATSLEATFRDFAESESLGLGKVAQPVRVALTGRTVSPGVFDMLEILGREESLARLEDCAKTVPAAE